MKLAGTYVAFSPDNSRLVAGGYDGTIKLWDIVTRQEVLTMEHSPPPSQSSWETRVNFSANGDALIARARGHCRVFWPPAISEFDLHKIGNLPSRHFVASIDTRSAQLSEQLPPRAPNAPPGLIDLTRFYNASLLEDWHGAISSGNNLASLPMGVQLLAGTRFDIRGVIQLGSEALSGRVLEYPDTVEGIPLNRVCHKIHFLHASGGTAARKTGALLGRYIINFANGKQEDIPIEYGLDVRDWWIEKNESGTTRRSVIAWTGSNTVAKNGLRLYKSTWTNSQPDIEVRSMDFVSAQGVSAPFLLAVTIE